MRFVMQVQVDCSPFIKMSFRQSKESKDLGLYMSSRCISVGKKSQTHELTYIADIPILDKIIEDIITNFDEAPHILDVEVIEYREE